MQLLAFKDPNGRVYLMDDADALPPLANGYEWTVVVRPDHVMANDVIEPEPEPYTELEPYIESEPAWTPSHRNAAPDFLDMLLPILTPRDGQSPQERAQELVDALPGQLRAKIGQLMRALLPPRQLPPFPGVGP